MKQKIQYSIKWIAISLSEYLYIVDSNPPSVNDGNIEICHRFSCDKELTHSKKITKRLKILRSYSKTKLYLYVGHIVTPIKFKPKYGLPIILI